MPTALMKKRAKEQASLLSAFQLTAKEADMNTERLKNRMNAHQLQKRSEKIAARRTSHELLERRQSVFMNNVGRSLAGFFNRSFFGRMKWLFAGK